MSQSVIQELCGMENVCCDHDIKTSHLNPLLLWSLLNVQHLILNGAFRELNANDPLGLTNKEIGNIRKSVLEWKLFLSEAAQERDRRSAGAAANFQNLDWIRRGIEAIVE